MIPSYNSSPEGLRVVSGRNETRAERRARLKAELAKHDQEALQDAVLACERAVAALTEVAGSDLRPGVREEARSLAEHITNRTTSMKGLGGR